MPLMVSLFVILIIGFILVKFIGVIFQNTRSEQVSADLQVLAGRTEYFFPEQQEWTGANSDLKFREGDAIRTNANSKASLELFAGTFVFLNENTELKIRTLEESSGRKNVRLEVLFGEVWVKTSPEQFDEETGSVFEVKTQRSQVNVNGTIFDVLSTAEQDTIRLIKGSVDVDVQNPETPEEEWKVVVDVGQKLVINPMTIEQLKAEADVKEIIDPEFIESEWHLENIEQFSPEEAAEIRRRIEFKAPKPVVEETKPEEPQENLRVSDEVPMPEITNPEENTVIAANEDTVVIKGTAPENTMQIVVNGYTLRHFTAGDRTWQYFASKEFGTLVPGENTYEVVAVFRDGTQSNAAMLTLTYEGTSEPESAADDSVIQSTISEYKAPVITKPAAIRPGGIYETSQSSFTISGLVDPKTNTVMVNDYKLRKFTVGDTEFRYTVNAEMANPNMVEGENLYTITTLGPDGKKASTPIKVLYKPVTLVPQ